MREVTPVMVLSPPLVGVADFRGDFPRELPTPSLRRAKLAQKTVLPRLLCCSAAATDLLVSCARAERGHNLLLRQLVLTVTSDREALVSFADHCGANRSPHMAIILSLATFAFELQAPDVSEKATLLVRASIESVNTL